MVIGVVNAVVAAAAVAGLLLLAAALFLFQFVNLWMQAWFSGVQISLIDLIGMRLRKVDPRVVVFCRISAVKAGLDVSINQLETHYLAGGRVQNVITALISAHTAAIELDWDTATSIDLAGRDIVDVVNGAVRGPRWIGCTDERGVQTRTQDGVPVCVKVRAKVRPCVMRTVGGAPEEALAAWVAEAAELEASRFADGRLLAREPGRLSRILMRRELDSEAAFEVLAYDVAVVEQ